MTQFVPERVREGMETHHSFLDYNKDCIDRGEPFVLQVMDLDTFEQKVVRAVVAPPGELGGEWKELWIKDSSDEVKPETWRIRVVEELDEEELLRIQRPGADQEEAGSLYGTGMTTRKMEQDALEFKKQFGREKLRKVKTQDE